jgi:hypothetical protein
MTQKQLVNLPIGPGVYTEQTERGAVGQWYKADKVRFRMALAEKIGGWVRLQPQFLGTCRRLKDWASLDAKKWAAVATDTKLYLWQDSTLYDITPIRDSGTLSNPFTTTNTLNTVNVGDLNHGAQAGDYVRFSGAALVGGLTIDGEYRIQSIVDSDNYIIVDDETATSSTTGGGTVSYEYDISAGAESVTTATGYGTGPYGREGYGNARTGSTLQLGIRTWSLDTWGEDLLASPRKGAIYWWDRSLGTGSRAVALGGDAPPNCQYMLVSQRDRHVLALGAYDYFNEAFDPMLIRWCSTEDLNDWVPTSENTSGDLRLYSGSQIVAGVRSRLETVIFTDVSVHTLPFVGGFDVFGLNIVGENVSILGPNAAVPVDHRVFFMAEADFYLYDGVVRAIPCTVRNHVYDNLNVVQRDKIYGGLNREFNEVWWFYPSFDPETWVQQDFSLALPPGYETANASSSEPNLYNDVLFQADWEGANGATTYTEESQYLESGTFLNNAQISTTSPIYDTSSLKIDGTNSCRVTFPIDSNLPWDGTGRVLTAEVAFRLDGTHSSTKNLILVGDDDVRAFAMGVFISGGVNYYLTGGFSSPFSSVGPLSMTTGVDYVAVIESDYTAGAGNGVERIWFGPKGGTVSLVATRNSVNPPGTSFTSQIIVGEQTTSTSINATVDHMRITNSTTGRYGTASTVTIDDPYPTVNDPGGPGNVGYGYVFNSQGYTERVPTAANNYEHDFFLSNDEPILTPTQSEYAVELDVNPSYTTGSAGLCFLRTDATGTVSTDADDCNQWMVELNKAANAGAGEVRIYKKEAAAPAAPDNLGGNTIDFTTLTGAAMTTGQKYVITVQFNTPQITVWVDGYQAFQFNMSTAELALFTQGTAGLHCSDETSGDQYRFYNFASGPVGVLSASDFDISPIEVNRYVAFNYEENTWTIGRMARTAWADRSPLLEKAYAAGTDGYLYQHETGTDDNGAAMGAYIQSYDMEVPNAGENLMHVDQLIPDFLELEGSVDVTLSGRKYPQDANRITKGPYTVANGTRKISTRIRARQVAIRVESNQTGAKWRMGTWRGRVGPHGKRG